MTDKAAHPGLLERAHEWLRQETHAHNAKAVVVDLVAKVAELEAGHGNLATRVAALEALLVKDGPAVVADVEKAAGAS